MNCVVIAGPVIVFQQDIVMDSSGGATSSDPSEAHILVGQIRYGTGGIQVGNGM